MDTISRNLNRKRASLPARRERDSPPDSGVATHQGLSPDPGTKKPVRRGVLIGCFGIVALFVIVPLALVGIFSEDDGDGDRTTEISKDGSVEITFSSKHIEAASDIVVAHYRIYKNNACISEYDILDTVPSLGTAKQEVETEKGDKVMKDVPNEYDLYVTVK